MKIIETMGYLIKDDISPYPALDHARKVLKAIHEPDPNVVAAVADKLQMDATKVAAVWMLMVEEAGK